MSLYTLNGLLTHFEAVTETIDGLSFFYDKQSVNNIVPQKTYPQLLCTTSNPDSLLSANDFHAGFNWETHNFVFAVHVSYTIAEHKSGVSVAEKHDAATALLMEFMRKAFSRSYITSFYLMRGIDNIPVSRRPFEGNDQVVVVQMEAKVKAAIGCSDYQTFNLCSPVTVYDSEGNAIETIAAGGRYDLDAPESFTEIINFEEDSDDTATYQMKRKGYIAAITGTNIASIDAVEIITENNATWQTADTPFDVEVNDVVRLSVTKNDAAQAATLTIKGFYQTVSETLERPEITSEGRYTAVLNYVDQTVSIISHEILNGATSAAGVWSKDGGTVTPVIATLSLPVLSDGAKWERAHVYTRDKRVYFFAVGHTTTLDVDDDSATFLQWMNAVRNTASPVTDWTSSAGFIHSAVFVPGSDAATDIFWLITNARADSVRISADHSNIVTLGTDARQGTIAQRSVYIRQLNKVFANEFPFMSVYDADSADTCAGFYHGAGGAVVFDKESGYLFIGGYLSGSTGSILVYNATNFRFVGYAIAFVGTQYTNAILTPNGYLWCGSNVSNTLWISDVRNGYALTTISKTSPATNENGTRGITYSPVSDRVLVQGLARSNEITGMDRIGVYSQNGSFVGYITVGNMDARANPRHQMGNQIGTTLMIE